MSHDMIRVSAGSLETMAAEITGAHRSMTEGFESLSSDLLTTIAEWGEGTESRRGYDVFKRRVDALFAEMFTAVQAMPPLVTEAAAQARQGEARRAAMWEQGG